jgi:Tat protein translocase TatB subunit
VFGIGFTEILIIGVILIVAVGPEKMPGLLKAVVKGYREFRKATRDLRASTGIDEILEDEDLKSLRQPLYIPDKPKPAPRTGQGSSLKAASPKAAPASRELTEAEHDDEIPTEGVDLAEVRASEREPDPQAIERRNAKLAISAREAEIVAAKEAVAVKRAELGDDAPETDEERVLREKLAAYEAERIQAKLAAHGPEAESEHERIVREKLAGAGLDPGDDVRPGPTPEEHERIVRAKLAAANDDDDDEPEEESEEQRAIREAKQAAYEQGEARRQAKLAGTFKPAPVEDESEA